MRFTFILREQIVWALEAETWLWSGDPESCMRLVEKLRHVISKSLNKCKTNHRTWHHSFCKHKI